MLILGLVHRLELFFSCQGLCATKTDGRIFYFGIDDVPEGNPGLPLIAGPPPSLDDPQPDFRRFIAGRKIRIADPFPDIARRVHQSVGAGSLWVRPAPVLAGRARGTRRDPR